MVELFLARLGGFWPQHQTGGTDARLSAASSLDDDRCHRAGRLPQAGFRQTSAGMDDGGANGKWQPPRPRGILAFDVPGDSVRNHCGAAASSSPPPFIICRVSIVDWVGGIAPARLFCEFRRALAKGGE